MRLWRVDSGETDANALREELGTAIESGRQVDGSAYEYQSYNVFQTALQYGQLVYNDITADYGTINSAIKLIEDTRESLKLKEEGNNESVRFVEDSQGVVSAVFEINGVGSDYHEALGVVAIYDEHDVLIEVSSCISLISDGELITEQIEVNIPSGCIAKAFLWNAETYEPLCESAIYGIAEDKTEITFTGEQIGKISDTFRYR